jgi:hypothetical protein
VNKLSVTDEETILGLLRLGWSERRISREGGYHRATIRRIRRRAELAPPKCTTPGEVPTDLGATRSSAEPFREFIEAEPRSVALLRRSIKIWSSTMAMPVRTMR